MALMPRALVIQLNRLGDMHQSLPVLRALETRYPGDKLVLLGCKDFSGALAEDDFRGLKVNLARARLAYWPTQLRACESGKTPLESLQAELPEGLRGRFELAVNLTHDEPSAAIMRLVDTEVQLGRVWSEAGEICMAGDWSKYLLAATQNRLDNLFNLVDLQLGIAGLPWGPRAPAIVVSQERKARARKLLREAGGDEDLPCLALQMGASDPFRALGPKKFAQSLNVWAEKRDLQVIAVGTEGERHLFRLFAEHYRGPCHSLQGKTRMEDLPAVLSLCRLLIGNDTGTLHAAASAGTPTLGLFFATAYFSETAPYGVGHGVLQAALPCSPCNSTQRCPIQHCRSAMTPEAVAAISQWMWDGRNGQAPGPFPGLDFYTSDYAADGGLLYASAPGWSASPQYRKALAWREMLGRHLGLPPFSRENLHSDLRHPPFPLLPYQHLAELAEALEGVSAQLMRLERTGSTPAEITAIQKNVRDAMHRLVDAQKPCGPWGNFVRFDLLGPELGGDLGLTQMRRRHLTLAARTREMLLQR